MGVSDVSSESSPSVEPAQFELPIMYPALAKSNLKHYKIAGQGEASEDCGDWVPSKFCSTCGRPHVTQHSCNRRLCPDCWEGWRAQAVEKAFKQIVGYDLKQWSEGTQKPLSSYSGISEQRYMHGVVSPSVDEDDEYQDVRDRAKELAKEAGFDGFGLIPHYYRITDEAKELLRFEGYDSEKGFWRAIIDDELDLGDWREYVEPGLHFHVVGFTGERWSGHEKVEEGQDVGGSDEIFHRIRDLDTVKDVKATLMYVSTHATPEDGKHWITYSGELAYVNFSAQSHLDTLEKDRLDRLYRDSGEAQTEEEEIVCEDEDCDGKELLAIWKAKPYVRDRGLDLKYKDELKKAFELMCFPDDVDDPPDQSDKESVEDWMGL